MKKILCLLMLFMNIVCLKAQLAKDFQTACATSAQGSISSFVISYTVGEMVLVDNYKSNGLFVTQGIAQPEVPGVIVNYSGFTSGDIIVFPNPTPNQLSIQISIVKLGKIKLQLYDAVGKLLLVDAFDVNSFMTQRYSLDKYADGSFVLRLQFNSNDGVMDKRGTYKIVKAN
jgi:hypothetical protein